MGSFDIFGKFNKLKIFYSRMVNLPPINIGGRNVYGFQGGMGVGISRYRLAAAVANEGWVGTIAAVGLGALGDFDMKDYEKGNADALRDEIRKARKISPKGFLAVNIMGALSDHRTLAEVAVGENIDAIVSGAGFFRDLSNIVDDKNINIIPIVGSGRVAELFCKSWGKKHSPDAIIIEGPAAGGHLAYTLEQLSDSNYVRTALPNLVKEVVEATKKYKTRNGDDIPIIAAGGIFYGSDIPELIISGASGVQMATRFVTTDECDAHENFKMAYYNCKRKDLNIYKSPVGMPARMIRNDFLKKVEANKQGPTKCSYHCLGKCAMIKAPFCIADALIAAVKGDVTNKGFAFAGARAYECSKIKLRDGKFPSVKEVIESIGREYELR